MINEHADAFPQGSLRCLRYLEKSTFGPSQLAKHTFIFTTLLVVAIMAWFLAVLFLDIGISYSLSTIVSTLPGAVLVGAPLASFLQLFLTTRIFDAFPRSSRRRSAYYWAAQVSAYGLLATSIGVVSKQSKVLCTAFWSSEKCSGLAPFGMLVMFLAPNLYVILLMFWMTMLVVLAATGIRLFRASKPQHTSQDSDQENVPLEVLPET